MLSITLIALAVPTGNPANNLQPGASEAQVVCRREVPTGSLIIGRELCMTKAEWNALERDYKDGNRETVYSSASRRN